MNNIRRKVNYRLKNESILTRKVFQVLHPDLVETLAIDKASPKINNREKNLGAILFFCPTGGMQFHLKIRIFGHSAR